MQNLNDYYVYAHIDDRGVLFYIGKGRRYRANVGASSRYRHWINHVNKYCASGKPEVIFIKNNLTNDEALLEEVFWISFYGRKELGKGLLINKTDGGDGASNVSEETRRKRGLLFKGKKLSKEHKLKLSLAKRGKAPHNKGIKTNKPAWNSGKKTGVPAWNRGISPSKETLEKSRLAHLGQKAWNRRPVKDLTTNIVYESAIAASKAVGKSPSGINGHCNNKFKNKKFEWMNKTETQGSKQKKED